MTAFPTICDTAADQQFQLAVREQFPDSYEFEARYVDHEMAHIGHLFATGVCPVEGKKVLEFGCNIGATSIVLTHYGARVTAVDISPQCIEMARLNTKRYGRSGVRFELLHEGRPLPFADGEFEVVTCNSVLEYVRPDLLAGVQRELNRVLKPGGLLLVFGTSNRLSPVEMHSGEWLNNYIPRRFDGISNRQRERGVWPWRLRHGFGPNYEDLFAGPTGAQRYIELKRIMGLNGWKLRLLSALGAFFAISPVSVPLVLPYQPSCCGSVRTAIAADRIGIRVHLTSFRHHTAMRLGPHIALALFVCLFGPGISAFGYSVLTHEQLIDLTWNTSIVPLLVSRYPTLTPAELEHARAYAYGGCVIQDIGYYPFGDKNFSNLTHYVRSGDFVVNLFRNAGNADELAFAVGALSHYIGDSVGHSQATNVAVPVEFPKLKRRYGNVVSYAEGEQQHVRTEFAFDIDEIANHRFAPVNYLRHVGLEVPTKQLALAFYQTYGLRVDFTETRHHRINVSDYRWAVHRFIPRIAYSTTLLHRHHEPADIESDPDVKRLIQEVAVIEQQNHWDDYRKHAGLFTYTLAGLLFILPKVGPIRLAAVKGPTSQTEIAYVHSVMRSTDALNHALRRFTPPPSTQPSAQQAAAADTHSLPPPSDPLPARPDSSQAVPRGSLDPHHPLLNRDLDTGNPVKPAGYSLTDQTYAYLLHQLAQTPAVPVPEGVKDDILAYYADMSLSFATKKDPAAWAAVQRDLPTLQTMPVNPWPVPYPTYGDGANDDLPPPATAKQPAS